MRVESIRLQNFRSFVDSGEIDLGQINVMTGPNNTGKSSIIRGLHALQKGLSEPVPFSDVQVGSSIAEIGVWISDFIWPGTRLDPVSEAHLMMTFSTSDRRTGLIQRRTRMESNTWDGDDFLWGNVKPNHFIVPVLSKRKNAYYREDVNGSVARLVTGDISYLAAKLVRLANPNHKGYAAYSRACEAILGIVVTANLSPNGQRPGHYLDDDIAIPIDQMGEGVPNIVLMLVDLAVSKGKLFLIEEPENDLHPQALKALLDLIAKSAEHNQFVISTHSNIVVSRLAGVPGYKLFHVTCDKEVLPTVATIAEVPEQPAARMSVLQELGYSFADFDLWDGWLLLEESSAERIIRDFLIPWFAPGLKRVRTLAANGVSKIEPHFEDLHRLLVYTHLQPIYAGRTWVRVDGDEEGKRCIEQLQEKFTSIEKEHFGTWSCREFERYYPKEFAERVEEVLGTPDKNDRRKQKKDLLLEVIKWLNQDESRAKAELAESAEDVIEDLRGIEELLTPQKARCVGR